jgi:hypothetical protein
MRSSCSNKVQRRLSAVADGARRRRGTFGGRERVYPVTIGPGKAQRTSPMGQDSSAAYRVVEAPALHLGPPRLARAAGIPGWQLCWGLVNR